MKQRLRGAAAGRSPDRRISRGRSELVRAPAAFYFPPSFLLQLSQTAMTWKTIGQGSERKGRID